MSSALYIVHVTHDNNYQVSRVQYIEIDTLGLFKALLETPFLHTKLVKTLIASINITGSINTYSCLIKNRNSIFRRQSIVYVMVPKCFHVPNWIYKVVNVCRGGGSGEKEAENDMSSCGSGDEDDLKDMKSEPEYIMQHPDNRHHINLVSFKRVT